MLLTALVLNNSLTAQNVITVKKKEEVKEAPRELIQLSPGLYYSEPIALTVGAPGEPPAEFSRMLVYIDQDRRQAYVFYSNKSLKKIYQQFKEKPEKFIEEQGIIELTSEGWIYLNTSSAGKTQGSYKYVGEYITTQQFYIDYKASYNAKAPLNVYLNKY